MAPVIAAYQAMRGVAFMTAVTFAAEIGDVCRFDNPGQLMAYLGLVPSESSTGERVRRGSITKSGNRRAWRALIEGAWTYRFPARISATLQQRLNGLPKGVRAISQAHGKRQASDCRRGGDRPRDVRWGGRPPRHRCATVRVVRTGRK